MRRIRWFLVPLGVLVGAAVWWLTSPSQPRHDATIDGQVFDSTGPVVGARVRLLGESNFIETSTSGSFHLARPRAATLITAYRDGYFIGSTPTERARRIELKKLPADHDGYRWVDPHPGRESFSCGSCHREIFDEWSASAHGRSPESSRFRDLFHGLDAKGKPGGWGLMHEHPDGADVCASCHNPAPLMPRDDERRQFGNVHCDFCHKVVGPAGGEIGLTHGRYGLKLLRPAEGQVTIGPREDGVRDDNAFAPIQKQSRLCASCHEGVVFGVHVYSTYSEWQASPAGRAGVQCQQCHMKPTGQMTNVAPQHGGAERDPATIANHHFVAGSHRDMLCQCLRLSLEALRDKGMTSVRVSVGVEGVGHRVPTGLPDRNLTLIVEAFDAGGKALGPRFEKLFAKRLKDWQGRHPVPFWRAAPEFDDTRLTPENIERFEFKLPASAAKVTAKLIYRKFWSETTREKGWPDDTWIVAERTIAMPQTR